MSINLNNVERRDFNGPVPIPEGDYEVKLESFESATTKNDNPAINLTFRILRRVDDEKQSFIKALVWDSWVFTDKALKVCVSHFEALGHKATGDFDTMEEVRDNFLGKLRKGKVCVAHLYPGEEYTSEKTGNQEIRKEIAWMKRKA